MAKVKGRSGRWRKGTGRPPEIVSIGRTFSLRAGESVQVSVGESDATQERLAVLHLERTEPDYRLLLASDNGWQVVIEACERSEPARIAIAGHLIQVQLELREKRALCSN